MATIEPRPRFVAPKPVQGEMQSAYLMRVVAAFEKWANGDGA